MVKKRREEAVQPSQGMRWGPVVLIFLVGILFVFVINISQKPGQNGSQPEGIQQEDITGATVTCQEWSRIFGEGAGKGIALDSAYVYATGYNHYVDRAGNSADYISTYKLLQPDGTLVWVKSTYNEKVYGRGEGVVTDGTYIYVVGTEHVDNNPGYPYIWIRKLASNGNTIWTRREAATAPGKGSDITVDSSGNIYVVGTKAYGSPPYKTVVWVRKLTSTGTTAWTKEYGDTAEMAGERIALDGLGNLYVTVNSLLSYTKMVAKVWKLDAATGNQVNLFLIRDNGFSLYDISVKGEQFAVTGVCVGFNASKFCQLEEDRAGNDHAYSTKRRGSDGATYWEKVDYSRYGSGISMPATTNVYVTGEGYGKSSWTQKKDGVTGNWVWTRADPDAKGYNIAVDSSAKAYIVGQKMKTSKIDALWIQKYCD